VLELLDGAGPLSGSYIAKALGRRRADVLAALRELEATGLVDRAGAGRYLRWTAAAEEPLGTAGEQREGATGPQPGSASIETVLPRCDADIVSPVASLSAALVTLWEHAVDRNRRRWERLLAAAALLLAAAAAGATVGSVAPTGGSRDA
jgi:hypothetical protein